LYAKSLQFLDAQLKDKTASIEATMRPDDILAKGVLSKSLMTDNVLLRITAPMRTGRKRKRGSSEPFTEDPEWESKAAIPADAKQLLRVLQDNATKYSVTPIGKINNTHRFRSLLDFQWTTSGNPLSEHMRETLLSSDYTKMKEFRIKPDRSTSPGPPIEAPPLFGFTPAPLPYAYRQNMYVKLITDENGVKKLVNIHQSPTHITHAVNVDASPEEIPFRSPIPLKPEDELDPIVQRIIKRLRVELERRPVMVRRVQVNFSGARGGEEKYAWAYLGYTFREGPFKDALVKFGVDPRSHPKYREYQTFSLQIPEVEKRTRLLRLQGVRKGLLGRQDTHIFDGNEFFTDGKVWQVCDMRDPVLRRIIKNATVSEEYEVSDHTQIYTIL
jgi:general transcription factor 3C polypeptide 5 (transcription factor C subunit 1)